MIGIREIVIGIVLLGVVAMFGKKTILKLVKEGFGLKKDVEDIVKTETKADKPYMNKNKLMRS